MKKMFRKLNDFGDTQRVIEHLYLLKDELNCHDIRNVGADFDKLLDSIIDSVTRGQIYANAPIVKHIVSDIENGIETSYLKCAEYTLKLFNNGTNRLSLAEIIDDNGFYQYDLIDNRSDKFRGRIMNKSNEWYTVMFIGVIDNISGELGYINLYDIYNGCTEFCKAYIDYCFNGHTYSLKDGSCWFEKNGMSIHANDIHELLDDVSRVF